MNKFGIVVILVVIALWRGTVDANTPNQIDVSNLETTTDRFEIYNFSEGTFSIVMSNVTSEFVVVIDGETIRSNFVERVVEGPFELHVIDGGARLMVRSSGGHALRDFTKEQKMLITSTIVMVAAVLLSLVLAMTFSGSRR